MSLTALCFQGSALTTSHPLAQVIDHSTPLFGDISMSISAIDIHCAPTAWKRWLLSVA
jgi:hypothetical protein